MTEASHIINSDGELESKKRMSQELAETEMFKKIKAETGSDRDEDKTELKIMCPWGMWDTHGGMWYPSLNLKMSAREQRNQNIANGYMTEETPCGYLEPKTVNEADKAMLAIADRFHGEEPRAYATMLSRISKQITLYRKPDFDFARQEIEENYLGLLMEHISAYEQSGEKGYLDWAKKHIDADAGTLTVLRKQIQDERMRNRQQLKNFLAKTEATVQECVQEWVMKEIEACCSSGGGFVEKVIQDVYDRFMISFEEWTESRKLKNRIKRFSTRILKEDQDD